VDEILSGEPRESAESVTLGGDPVIDDVVLNMNEVALNGDSVEVVENDDVDDGVELGDEEVDGEDDDE